MIKKVRVSTFLVRQPLAFVASLVPYCTLAFRHSDSEPEASDNRLTHQVFLQTFESGDYHLQQSCFAEAPFSATRLILVPHVADPGQYSLSQIIVPGGRDTLKVKGWPSPTGANLPCGVFASAPYAGKIRTVSSKGIYLLDADASSGPAT